MEDDVARGGERRLQARQCAELGQREQPLHEPGLARTRLSLDEHKYRSIGCGRGQWLAYCRIPFALTQHDPWIPPCCGLRLLSVL